MFAVEGNCERLRSRIRRLPSGTIDSEFYIDAARRRRSEGLVRVLKSLFGFTAKEEKVFPCSRAKN